VGQVPFAAILGGAKISGKIDVITNLMDKVDYLMIGGGMVFTFSKAMGNPIGDSLLEEDKLDLAKEIIEKVKSSRAKLVFPSDIVAAREISDTADTSVVVVTHDPKLDDPALMAALPSPAFYVGALGSPKTHARRVERLLAEGVDQAYLNRLHAPIGLNIGGRTPAEIALSIMAEIVAVRHQMPVAHK